jgi:hypothetical protein
VAHRPTEKNVILKALSCNFFLISSFVFNFLPYSFNFSPFAPCQAGMGVRKGEKPDSSPPKDFY